MNRLLSILKKQKNSPLFLERKEHSWFSDSLEIAEVFNTLYSLTSNHKNIREFLHRTIFTQSNGQYASAVCADVNLVIVYPELTYLMKSAKKNQAIGILLHEIGHLILGHQTRDVSNDQAQIEADLFSLELGYGNYLLDFLKDQRRTEQIEKRIEALKQVLKSVNSSDSLLNN